MTLTLTRKHLIGAGILLFLAAIALWWFAFDGKYPGMKSEADRTVAEVGRLMYLPEGEVPTVATITDLAALQGQPFFANAKVGYRVLIYTKGRRVILYDPEAHKIVDVSPLTIEAGVE